MSQLILRDADGVNVGCRVMEAHERLFFYRAWDTHDLISFEGKRYLIKTVAWRMPEEDLVLSVIFDSWEPPPYCDD
jgi:hypothetical protein